MPKGSKELTDARKDEIIASARALYEKKSFKEITIKDIAEDTSFTRTSIYNYFETKEEIFLSLLKEQYEEWIKSLEKIRDGNERLSREEFAYMFSSTLENATQMLRLLSMNLYDLEENSRLSFLVDFKKTYANALSIVSSLIGKFFPSFSEKDISSFLYSFFPFMYGVYPYTMMTEKQLIAMREVGIEIYKIPIRDFVYKTVIKLLGGEDNE